MDPTPESRAREIFAQAVEMTPEELSTFLKRRCGNDVELRQRVEALLRAHADCQARFGTEGAPMPVGEMLDAARRAAPSQQEPRFVSGQALAHYRLDERVGHGGMGVVWKAHDTKLNRPVALKILRTEFVGGEEHQRRFLREARSAAVVTHPYIASIYDADQTDVALFIAMEFVDGRTIRALLDEGAISVPEAMRYAIEIAEGLAKVHELQLVHRDLKPDNIMVATDGHVRILDFGLAKLVEKRDELAKPHRRARRRCPS